MRVIAFSRAPAFEAALEGGLFAAEGLEVSFTKTASSRAQLDALLAGEHDVAHTAADNVFARVDSGDDLCIVLVADRGIEHRLVGAADVRALSEFAGRRLGVDAPESGHALLAYVLLAEAGVARGRYEVVPVGSTPERASALLERRIDAAMLSAPHDERALAGGAHVLADPAVRFPEHPRLVVAVARRWAAAHRDEVDAYCRALLRGARVTGSVPSVDEMVRSLASAYELRRLAGLATAPFEVGRYFDPAYAHAAETALSSR